MAKREHLDPGQRGPRWVSLDFAAAFLGLQAGTLRRTLERKAVRSADGGIEASFDGVRARKFGRLWRVSFAASWLVEDEGQRS